MRRIRYKDRVDIPGMGRATAATWFYATAALFFLSWSLGGSPQLQAKPQVEPQRAPSSRVRFEDLTAFDQRTVRTDYTCVLEAHERKDYEVMSRCAEDILSRVPEYNDTRAYATIAQNGLNETNRRKGGR